MSERADALRPLPSRAVTIRPRLATPSARPATAPPSKEMTMTGTSHPGPLTPLPRGSGIDKDQQFVLAISAAVPLAIMSVREMSEQERGELADALRPRLRSAAAGILHGKQQALDAWQGNS